MAQIGKSSASFFGRWIKGWRSENIGGLVSMAGSCLFLLGGDASGIIVSASFLIAEVILAKWGHARAGYSLGCILFSFGDAMALTSNVAANNSAFQIALAAMAMTWALGALRGPLAWYGARSNSTAFVRLADALQPISGSLTLVLRIPGIVTAVGGANLLGAAAVACWAIADILVGRLQDAVGRLVRR
jgi:hypothetical protein